MIRKRSGFSLLEILLAVATLVILAGIVIITINQSKQLAGTRNSENIHNDKNIQIEESNLICKININSKKYEDKVLILEGQVKIINDKHYFIQNNCKIEAYPLVPYFLLPCPPDADCLLSPYIIQETDDNIIIKTKVIDNVLNIIQLFNHQHGKIDICTLIKYDYFFLNANFYLEGLVIKRDNNYFLRNNDCEIKINPWLPISTVVSSDKNDFDSQVQTMTMLIDKKLILFSEFQFNNDYFLNVEEFYIIND